MSERQGPEPDEQKSDTPMTRQTDDASVPGRQKYRSARPPGDYTDDFAADGTIAHPVKDDTGDDEAGSATGGAKSGSDRT